MTDAHTEPTPTDPIDDAINSVLRFFYDADLAIRISAHVLLGIQPRNPEHRRRPTPSECIETIAELSLLKHQLQVRWKSVADYVNRAVEISGKRTVTADEIVPIVTVVIEILSRVRTWAEAPDNGESENEDDWHWIDESIKEIPSGFAREFDFAMGVEDEKTLTLSHLRAADK